MCGLRHSFIGFFRPFGRQIGIGYKTVRFYQNWESLSNKKVAFVVRILGALLPVKVELVLAAQSSGKTKKQSSRFAAAIPKCGD